MAVLDIDPAQNPESASVFKFYKQGFPEDSGVTFNSEGDVKFASMELTGAIRAAMGIQIQEGSNATMGSVTLVAGVATVATSQVRADSRILLTSQNDSGTPGAFRISARNPGSDFTIRCTQTGNTSLVAWVIFNPY